MEQGEPAPANARGGIQALDAALIVLRALAGTSGPVTLSDLARLVDMPVSKVHRYLASFIHAGLVTQERRSGRYDLGPVSSELGLASLARNDFVNRTADALPDLAADTGLTVLLSVWANGGATVVRLERAPSPIMTSFGLGSTLPLLTSASGRVFLAFLPRRVTSDRLAHEFERAVAAKLDWPEFRQDPVVLESMIAKVRSERLAAVDGRFVPGLRAIAAPVTDWSGEAQLAVTLVGTMEDILIPRNDAQLKLGAFTDRLSVPQRPDRDV